MCRGTVDVAGQSVWVWGLSPRVRGNRLHLPDDMGDARSIPACAGEPASISTSLRTFWVYPRVCGGTLERGISPSASRGLSPRVRGNRLPRGLPPAPPRSIPACAGEPANPSNLRAVLTVYPRVCGGTYHPPRLVLADPGLSPRVRGNLHAGVKHLGGNRSIPACAGEPVGNRPGGVRCGVYPRVCGGTSGDAAGTAGAFGLSPRVRGNPLRGRWWALKGRSIPACAGEPETGERRPRRNRVYPRVCGGTRARRSIDRRGAGLSPRVRGNLLPNQPPVLPRRSIPVCAGEPVLRSWRTTRRRVYPRVCGGTDSEVHSRHPTHGLSPRVRGNRPTCTPPGPPLRSIPACAGEPAPYAPDTPTPPVYPRVCGGTARGREAGATVRGLSPRVRGNLEPTHEQARSGRSIPACAGEPLPQEGLAATFAVYPRVCGGTLGGGGWAASIGGLSPRVRGNPSFVVLPP